MLKEDLAQAREMFRFADEGRAWPTGENLGSLPSDWDDGPETAKAATLSNSHLRLANTETRQVKERKKIDAKTIRRVLTAQSIKAEYDLARLKQVYPGEDHHQQELDELDFGVYTNSTVVIIGVEIEGKLDLRASNIERPVYFYNCSFADGINLMDATVSAFGLFSCDVGSVEADRIEVTKSLLLRESRFTGPVSLAGATIKSQLSCEGASFEPKDGSWALAAYGCTIGGGVFLGDAQRPLRSTKTIDFSDSNIGSVFFCTAGDIGADNSSVALKCIDLKTGGKVRLGIPSSDQKVTFRGQVDFRGSRIGGAFELCAHPISTHFLLEQADIDGKLEVGNTEIEAMLSVAGSRISGSLVCDNLHLRRPSTEDGQTATVFCLRGTTVEQDFRWTGINFESGVVDLSNASVRTLCDQKSGWPKPEPWLNRQIHKFSGRKRDKKSIFILNGFAYARLDGNSPRKPKERIQWLECQPSNYLNRDFQPFAWTQLVKVLKAEGHDGGARAIAIDREKRRTRRNLLDGHLFSYFYNALMHRIVGFGYVPFLGVVISMLCVAAGGIYYQYAYNNNAFAPANGATLIYMEQENKALPPKGYSPFNPWIYSADIFLPFAEFRQSTNWHPYRFNTPSSVDKAGAKERIGFRGEPTWFNLTRMVVWIETVIGAIVTSLTGIAFTGILKRE